MKKENEKHNAWVESEERGAANHVLLGTLDAKSPSKGELKGRLEAILFASGDALSVPEICLLLEVVPDAAEILLEEMAADYQKADRGIRILRLEDRVQLATKTCYSAFVRKLAQVNERQTLSNGALECLSIVAYKQPVTRVEVDEIRGVSSEYVLSKLAERSFITVVGRKNVPGKPKLYATTEEFLRQFGFPSLQAFTADPAYDELLKGLGSTGSSSFEELKEELERREDED
ncbi:Segregation and condensation protein B [Clostridiaceae bacterium JG1575]|nr:Segregation and condensation protein B [Clostridiaceae bacterium JG1575]